MARAIRYYWDACLWIELIANQDAIRGQCCKYVLELAETGRCEIWTSAFTLAEVYEVRCGGTPAALVETQDRRFEDYIEQEFVKKISVDVDIGKLARRLLRKFPKIGKPQDAVHVASYLLYNIDELHTFDRTDLIGMSGQIERLDRATLKICQPPYPPPDSKTSEPNMFPETE